MAPRILQNDTFDEIEKILVRYKNKISESLKLGVCEERSFMENNLNLSLQSTTIKSFDQVTKVLRAGSEERLSEIRKLDRKEIWVCFFSIVAVLILLKNMKRPEQRIHVKREGGFLNDAKVYAELKGLSWLAGSLKSLRHLAMIYYFSILAFILLTAGIFMVVIRALNQFQNSGSIYFDNVIAFGSILSLICLVSSYWLLREKRWIEIFQIDKGIYRLLNGFSGND